MNIDTISNLLLILFAVFLIFIFFHVHKIKQCDIFARVYGFEQGVFYNGICYGKRYGYENIPMEKLYK